MDPVVRGGFQIGEFAVYPLRNEIIGPHGSVHVAPKAMDVLCSLAEEAGGVVERDRLLESVWGRTVIGDDVLTRCISELRSAFGDSATDSRYIQTVPKRGYCLLAAVGELAESAEENNVTNASVERGFWEEIRERSVFRVGMAYAAVAWLVIQLAETTFPYLRLSDAAIRYTVIGAIAGLPIALVLAWLYEITPRGIVRDQGGRRPAGRSARFRRLDLFTVAVVVIGVSVLIYQQSFDDPSPATVDESATVDRGASRDAHGIAVLPFENLTRSPDNAYIGDGLAEDLIHLLAKDGVLRVSPRVASFFYRDKGLEVATIASRLQVDSILSGSVRIDDNSIIVVTSLLDMNDGGQQIWSERITKPLGDIFEVQNEIARAVVGELRLELDADIVLAEYRAPTESLGAYEFFGQAREFLRRPVAANWVDTAEGLLNRALQLDPEYAEAYALLCEADLARYEMSYASDSAAFERARGNCTRAESLDATNPYVNLALGTLYRHAGQLEESKRELTLAIQQNRRLVDAYIQLGLTLNENTEAAEAERTLRQAVELDRGYFASYWELGNFLMTKQRFEEARDYYKLWTELTPSDPTAYNNVAGAYFMLNDFEGASDAWERSLELRETRSTYTNLGLAYYYDGNFERAVEMQRRAAVLAPTDHRIWGRLAESSRFVDGLETESLEAYHSAIRFAEERLDINARDWETVALLALYQAHVGSTDEALITLGRGLALAADQPDMHYFAALTYLEIGKTDEAFDALSESLQMGFSPRLVTADPDIAPLLSQPPFTALSLDEPSTNNNNGE